MIRSILADIGKLWQYYPLFSPRHPRQSILNWQLSPRDFYKGQVSNNQAFSSLKTAETVVLKWKSGNHSSISAILSFVWLASVHLHTDVTKRHKSVGLYCPISRENEGKQVITKLLFHLSSVISEFSSQVKTCCSFQSYLLQENT